jgi:hypothetical protein
MPNQPQAGKKKIDVRGFGGLVLELNYNHTRPKAPLY